MQLAGIEDALLQVEVPRPVLVRHQLALQPVGQLADDAGDIFHVPVQHQPQPVELFRVAQVRRSDDFVEARLEDAVGVLRLAAVLVVALHVGMRRVAVGHALVGPVRLDHLAILAGTAVAGIFHRLAVIAFRLILADG